MAENLDPKLLDKRVAHRFIKKGLLDEREYQKHLKTLPDAAEKAAPVEATIEETDIVGTGKHSDED